MPTCAKSAAKRIVEWFARRVGVTILLYPPPAAHLEPAADNGTDVQADPLTQLHTNEQTLSDSVIQLESEHKALSGQHRVCLKELRDLYAEIEAIKQDLETKSATYEQIVIRNNSIVEQMNTISEQRRKEISTLEDIRNQIRALEVVVLYVCSNGDIEVMDHSDVALDDTGNDSLYSELLQRDDIQDLRLRDIRTVAKVASIIKNSPFNLQPFFENEDLGPLFDSLRQSA